MCMYSHTGTHMHIMFLTSQNEWGFIYVLRCRIYFYQCLLCCPVLSLSFLFIAPFTFRMATDVTYWWKPLCFYVLKIYWFSECYCDWYCHKGIDYQAQGFWKHPSVGFNFRWQASVRTQLLWWPHDAYLSRTAEILKKKWQMEKALSSECKGSQR